MFLAITICIGVKKRLSRNYSFPYKLPHQWRRGFELKTSRRVVWGSISSHACRLSRSEIFVIFSETRFDKR